jgi:hypothetical protein
VRFDIAVQYLVDAGVEFVLIGGWAAILNGSVHTTRDLGICYARNAENHRRLALALAPIHPRLRDISPGLPCFWDATTLANGSFFTLTTTLGAIDLLAEVAGLGPYEKVKAASKLVDAFDRQVWALDLRGLIAAKKAAGLPKDLQVLPELESLLEASED